MKIIVGTLALFLAAAPACASPALLGSASAKGDLSIAAVVGEDAVSTYDVANRMKFIIATTKLPDTPEMLERIRPQVMRQLIDEKLQLHEATAHNVVIKDEDVDHAIAGIEQQRGMMPGAIDRMLQEHNVPRSTFTDQIRAQLAWSKLLIQKIRPQVKISDEEIQLATKRVAATVAAVKQEWQIAVLALPVDKPSRESEMRKLADRLVKEMRSGASFEEVSRQFSSNSSGGKVETFWVRPEQLDPAVAKALSTAGKGAVTDPVRTGPGFTIVKVYDTRALEGQPQAEIEVMLKEILLKLKPDAGTKEAGAMLQIGEEVAKHPGTCEEKGVANIDNLQDFAIEVNFNRTRLSDLPPALKIIAEGLKVGEISTPFASDEGIRLYMLCDKKETSGAPTPDRDRIYAMLMQQKMELEAQKYLRNLRRETFIEVR